MDETTEVVEGPEKTANAAAKMFLKRLEAARDIRRVTKEDGDIDVGEGNVLIYRPTGAPFLTLTSKRFSTTEAELMEMKPAEILDGLYQEIIDMLPTGGPIYLLNSCKVWVNKVANKVEMQVWIDVSWVGCKERLGPAVVKLPV